MIFPLAMPAFCGAVKANTRHVHYCNTGIGWKITNVTALLHEDYSIETRKLTSLIIKPITAPYPQLYVAGVLCYGFETGWRIVRILSRLFTLLA
ncbi:MAG: hypothetical protein JWP45_3106 [Mucilaginibacter sp.]|nr:hypothetical protein [Mucilaginibacter sp.]